MFNTQVLFNAASQFRGGKFVWFKDAAKDNRGSVLNGNRILNPYKGQGYAFAADLFEYKLSGEGYLFKVFKVAAAVTGTDTIVKVSADGWSHIPEVGNILMKAPDTVTATGKSGKVTSITHNATDGVFELEITANALGSLAEGDLLVEAKEESTTSNVLVKNPNTFIVSDEFFSVPTDGSFGFTDVDYSISTFPHGAAFVARMSPLPKYVLAKNKSLIEGVFEL